MASWSADKVHFCVFPTLQIPTGNSGRYAGQQVEGRFRYWVVPGSIQINTGAAYLFKGDFLRNAPNAPQTGDTIYGYFSTTFFF